MTKNIKEGDLIGNDQIGGKIPFGLAGQESPPRGGAIGVEISALRIQSSEDPAEEHSRKREKQV